jgi:hypothetical protein
MIDPEGRAGKGGCDEGIDSGDNRGDDSKIRFEFGKIGFLQFRGGDPSD